MEYRGITDSWHCGFLQLGASGTLQSTESVARRSRTGKNEQGLFGQTCIVAVILRVVPNDESKYSFSETSSKLGVLVMCSEVWRWLLDRMWLPNIVRLLSVFLFRSLCHIFLLGPSLNILQLCPLKNPRSHSPSGGRRETERKEDCKKMQKTNVKRNHLTA